MILLTIFDHNLILPIKRGAIDKTLTTIRKEVSRRRIKAKDITVRVIVTTNKK